MPCCGNQRATLQTPIRTNYNPGPSDKNREQSGRVLRDRVFFKYLGQTGMTVIGPRSGKRYRFDATGSIVEVDPRDRPSLAGLAQLREVR